MSRHYALLGLDKGQDLFVKLVPSSVDEEFEKAMAIYNISRKSHSFVAPEPLSCCLKSKVIVYKALPPFQDVGHMVGLWNQRYRDDHAALNLFRAAGEILAEIHGSLEFTRQHETFLPAIFRAKMIQDEALLQAMDGSPVAHLHWDYGFSNLLVLKNSEANPMFCVIDAVPQIIKGPSITDKGSIYIDIGMFISQLYVCAFPAKYYPQFQLGRSRALACEFLRGYENYSEIQLNRYAAFGSADLVAELYSSLFYKGHDIRSQIRRAITLRGRRRLASDKEGY